MFTRHGLNIVFLGVVLFSLAACDSAKITDSLSPQEEMEPMQTSSPEFAQARKQSDASIISNSIDDIFVRLANRFGGFGGAYENDDGQLVLVSRQPESTRAARDELAAE